MQVFDEVGPIDKLALLTCRLARRARWYFGQAAVIRPAPFDRATQFLEERMSTTNVQPAPHIRPVGPVDVLVVGFPDARPDGSIAEAIGELVADGTVRILDLVLVYKDDSGEVILAEVTDIDGDGVPDLIAIQGDVPGLLTDADARSAAEDMPAGSAIALLAWENTWAIRAGIALRRQGAVVLAHQRIAPDVVDAALDELEAMIDDDTDS
ncbi:MAG TPA: DUF6325 family protein [Candidatus Nanopelagicales bacterium]|jgi:hypothetical protein